MPHKHDLLEGRSHPKKQRSRSLARRGMTIWKKRSDRSALKRNSPLAFNGRSASTSCALKTRGDSHVSNTAIRGAPGRSHIDKRRLRPGKPFVRINRQRVGGGGSAGRISMNKNLVKNHTCNVQREDAQQRKDHIDKESLALTQKGRRFQAGGFSFPLSPLAILTGEGVASIPRSYARKIAIAFTSRSLLAEAGYPPKGSQGRANLLRSVKLKPEVQSGIRARGPLPKVV